MSNSYWDKILTQRASRRGVVVGGVSLAGAAALLAACGGGSDSGGDNGGASGSSKVFTDTNEEGPVVKGGTYHKWVNDPANLDLYRQTAAGPKNEFGLFAMNRIVNFKIGPGVSNFQTQGDLGQSWEVTDGGLTYTFKLRQGVKFHNIAPVSGRTFDSEDVIASWKRFTVGVGDGALSGNKTGSPLYGGFDTVDSVSAPDKNTVVFKVKKPNAAFLTTLAASDNGFFIFPKEADITYDPTKQVIGTGPWIVSNYVPSVRLEYVKNPDYYEGAPYMDGFISYFITEAAQRLAQFQSGSIDLYAPDIFEDFQDLTRNHPNLRILSSRQVGSTQGINFGRLDPESPFVKDDRVRQALSLGIDRTTIIEELNDIGKYKNIGLEIKYRHGTYVPAFLDDYWIDPRGKEMGDSAQWYAFDQQKAKQLLSAAGYGNGLAFDQRYASRNQGSSLNVHPILQADWQLAGFQPKITPEDYDSVFNSRSWRGEAHGGVAIHGPQVFPDPAQQIDFLLGPTGTRNALKINDAKLNALQDRNLAELDTQKRRAIVIEELQYASSKMWHVPLSWSTVESLVLHQPRVRNNAAYWDPEEAPSASGRNTMRWWLAS